METSFHYNWKPLEIPIVPAWKWLAGKRWRRCARPHHKSFAFSAETTINCRPNDIGHLCPTGPYSSKVKTHRTRRPAPDIWYCI